MQGYIKKLLHILADKISKYKETLRKGNTTVDVRHHRVLYDSEFNVITIYLENWKKSTNIIHLKKIFENTENICTGRSFKNY